MRGKSRNKSYQIIVERNTASLVLVQAILTKSDRKVVSSADVMHTLAQMTLKIHHHQIGDGHALAVLVSWWEIWLFTMLLPISGFILDMGSKCWVGCKNGLSAA